MKRSSVYYLEKCMCVLRLIGVTRGIVLLMIIFWHSFLPSIILGILLKGRCPVAFSVIGGAVVVSVSYYFTESFYPGIDFASGIIGESIEAFSAWIACSFLFNWGYISGRNIRRARDDSNIRINQR